MDDSLPDDISVWIAASSADNPYMSLLCDHLDARGLEVREDVEPSTDIVGRSLFGGPPDILHIHWLYLFFLNGEVGPLGRPYAKARARFAVEVFRRIRRYGTRVVWTAHNLGNHENQLVDTDEWFHRSVAQLADSIIAHSEHAGERLADALDVQNRSKIHVVPHGHYIDTYPNDTTSGEAREELSISSDERVILFLGQIRPYKNVPKLIETFRTELADVDARLVIAGKPASDELERTIRSTAAEDDRISLTLGFVPDDQLQFYLNAADVATLPYRDILTSGSAVLAMSYGLPVVAPDIGTLRDVVGDEGGFLYDPDAEAGLGGALAEAVDADTDELANIGERNLERARGWDWDTVARQTHEVYEHALRQ